MASGISKYHIVSSDEEWETNQVDSTAELQSDPDGLWRDRNVHWANLGLLCINISILAMLVTYTYRGTQSVIHSPASRVLEYYKHEYNDSGAKSYYIQPPSPEIDERWHELILGNFIRLSQDDLRKVGRLDQDPVLLDDGSGVGLINAHHEIHCVMSLYHASWPEYYYPNTTLESMRHHIDHCLDYLLQASMCHGDVGFMTYHWHEDRLDPFWRAAQHSCIDWDGLRGWMRERKAPIHEPGFLVHPRLGPVYPDGAQKVPTANE